jgi:hypothetical protein
MHSLAPKEHISAISLKYLSESEWLRPLREYMETDLQRSADSIASSEDQRAKLTGFGTNKQGQAITRRYREQLADAIEVYRAAPAISERQVWAAIIGRRHQCLLRQRPRH